MRRLAAWTAGERPRGLTAVMALQELDRSAADHRAAGRPANAARLLAPAADLAAAMRANADARRANPRFDPAGERADFLLGLAADPAAFLARLTGAHLAAGDTDAAAAAFRRAVAYGHARSVRVAFYDAVGAAREAGGPVGGPVGLPPAGFPPGGRFLGPGGGAGDSAAVADREPPALTPPSRLALRVAEETGFGGPGGDFALRYLTIRPRDAGTDTAAAELAFGLQDAGRDGDALSLLWGLYKTGNLARVPDEPDGRRRSRHAEGLARLRGLLRNAGDAGAADGVAAAFRNAFPDDPRARFGHVGVSEWHWRNR